MTDSPDNRIELARVNDAGDDVFLSADAMSLLLGVPAANIRQLDQEPLPEVWVKAGQRRRKEAVAHTGSNEIIEGLRYWAAHDHDAVLEIDSALTVFMVSPGAS
ncbi:hypothetical protein BST44_02740 [Mycobacterium scrofulaceum]|uniref:Uncharacterized protein n=2 Tax=Mycobacterium scrofulaceum TaxID=1783 RepID=A0A1X0KKU0_MYCSC|nr:hypothetical protein BST44_02740 [Mycobacterium scrofulaceum]